MSDDNIVTGTVDTYYEKGDGSPHGLVIGDTKYTTFEDDIPEIQEGDEVRFEEKTVEKNGNTYHNIVEGTLEKVDTTPGGSDSDNGNSDDVFGDTNSKSSGRSLTKDERIMKQCALKEGAKLAAPVLEALLDDADDLSDDALREAVSLAQSVALQNANTFAEEIPHLGD